MWDSPRGCCPSSPVCGERRADGFRPPFLAGPACKDDTDLALHELQAYLEELPYVEGFKKKLEEVSTAEGFYEWSFYLIFSMLNVYVQTQVKCARGKADMVVFMPDTIYVMELKINGTAQDALDQINDRGYALRYATDGRRIVKVRHRLLREKPTSHMTDFIVEG